MFCMDSFMGGIIRFFKLFIFNPLFHKRIECLNSKVNL